LWFKAFSNLFNTLSDRVAISDLIVTNERIGAIFEQFQIFRVEVQQHIHGDEYPKWAKRDFTPTVCQHFLWNIGPGGTALDCTLLLSGNDPGFLRIIGDRCYTTNELAVVFGTNSALSNSFVY
jgi:hypothetical protein